MAKITIEINTEDTRWKKDFPTAKKIIKNAITTALNESGFTKQIKNIEVSVLLTNNQHIQEFNRDYRQKDKATNVLSFPLENFNPGQYADALPYVAIGDIIFALEIILQEATEQNKTFEHHLAHLAVHGALHLIGYDHEEDKEAKVMENLEIQILSNLQIPSPY